MNYKKHLIIILFLSLLAACSSTSEKPLDLEEGLLSASAPLENGSSLTGLSGPRLEQLFYTLNVPEGATNLEVKMSGGSGDADLYVRFGANPTVRRFDCRPYRYGNNESCRTSLPDAGTYYILVRGYSAFSAVNLKTSFTAPDGSSPEATVLENGVSLKNLSGSRGDQDRFTIELPANAKDLNVSISGGSGDADLYLKYATPPSIRSFDCRPYLERSNETCKVANPKAGTYYVMLRAYVDYRNVTLTATYEGDSTPPTPPAPTEPTEPTEPTNPAPSTGNFDITFVFGSSITNAQKQAFNTAAARWEQVITGDLPNTQINKQASLCGQGEPALNGEIDDVVIYAEVAPQDGPGGLLAFAGPCIVRNGGLTTYGIMSFDSADAGGPAFVDTILHEMGHVLGLGTLWSDFGLVNYTNNCPANPRYSGASARAEWLALGGSGNIPVEQDGGGGTSCGHWDEETFDTELMTGYLNGNSEPLSRMTIASLEDMGYVVDKTAADPYTIPPCSPNCTQSSLNTQNLHNAEELMRPIGIVNPNGDIEIVKPETN